MTRARDNSFNPFNNNYAGKNAVINGSFDHWQRGTSFSGATGYTTDRWLLFGANPERSVSRQTGAPDEFTFCARVGRSVGSSSVVNIPLSTSFETAQVVNLRDQFLTLSFYARKGANYSQASSALAVNVLSGTGTNGNLNTGFTSPVSFITATPILTTSWQKFTFKSSAALGTTIGQLGIRFQMTPVGTAGAEDYFEVAGVQLEIGSTATAFSRSGGTIQGELADCQRYYQRKNSVGNGTIFAIGQCQNTTNAYYLCPTPVQLRAAPSVFTSEVVGWTSSTGNAGGAIAVFQMSADAVSLQLTGGSGLVAGNASAMAGSTANAYLELNAEL